MSRKKKVVRVIEDALEDECVLAWLAGSSEMARAVYDALERNDMIKDKEEQEA